MDLDPSDLNDPASDPASAAINAVLDDRLIQAQEQIRRLLDVLDRGNAGRVLRMVGQLASQTRQLNVYGDVDDDDDLSVGRRRAELPPPPGTGPLRELVAAFEAANQAQALPALVRAAETARVAGEMEVYERLMAQIRALTPLAPAPPAHTEVAS